METLIGLGIGLVFFISTVSAYSMGVKHGRIVKNDGVPNVNPVKAVREIKQQVKEGKQIDMLAEGLQNILSFGEPVQQKERK